jgi:DivIVA domain-containing protein
MRDKKQPSEAESSFSRTPSAPRAITPAEIQQKEFGVSRLGGYKMRDVDEFLDELTDSVGTLVAENERLRRGGGPVVGAPDLDEVARQADEIIQRARDEAARIVAEAGGGSPSSLGARVSSQERTAVAAFLQQEREFLQGLGTLVQGHAEVVKRMARQSRTSETPPREPTPQASAAAKAPAQGVPAPPPPSPQMREAAQKEEPQKGEAAKGGAQAPPKAVAPAKQEAPAPARTVSRDEPTQAIPRSSKEDDTVRVEDREPARVARDNERTEGDPSLRDLFWGDET